MHLKRYRASSVRDALAQARGELGASALVLATRLVPRAGWRGIVGQREVELTAALESPLSGIRRSAQPAPSTPLDDSHAAPRGARLEAIIARLCATGLDRDLAEAVAAALPRFGRRAGNLATLQRALEGQLGVLAAGVDSPAAVEVFIGPPGAGKTTTIAKIAAQARVKRGERLHLIAADGYRLGAVEQLRLYAEVLGAPFGVVRCAADLGRALAGSRPPVLVDTAGRSPRDEEARDLFAALRDQPSVRTHLVVPAGATARDLERIVERYQHARPDRILFTKVDEADSISPLIGLLRRHRLPISYLGTGQRVPEDLEPATTTVLATHVLGELPPSAGPSS